MSVVEEGRWNEQKKYVRLRLHSWEAEEEHLDISAETY